MKITTVLFDLDGTLLPMDQDVFVKAYFGGLTKKLAPLGYEPEVLVKAIWKGTEYMIKNDGKASNESVFWNAFAEIFGEKVREDETTFDHFYRNEFSKVKEVCGFNPAALKVIELLRDKGITTALATNPIFPQIATHSRVKWAGLKPEDFALITTYENSNYCKPNPKYFLEITEKLGVTPEECLMVGNDVGDDMVAEDLGMKVFLLTDNLINKSRKDISRLPKGDFDDLLIFIEKITKL